jgi:hypothetical protein
MSLLVTPATYILAGWMLSLFQVYKGKKILYQCKSMDEKESLIEVFEIILNNPRFKFHRRKHSILINSIMFEDTEIMFSVIGPKDSRYMKEFKPDEIISEDDLYEVALLLDKPKNKSTKDD